MTAQHSTLITMPDSRDYMTTYLKRINDLEKPLPLDSKVSNMFNLSLSHSVDL